MPNVLFTKNADLLSGLTTGTWKWLVAKSGYTPDQDNHDFVNDVTNEMSGSGYSRQTVTGATRTPGTGQIVYDATTDPNFGNVVAGETGTWLILYKFVTNDADSPIVFALAMSKPTTGGAYTCTLDPGGFATLAQG